MPVDVQVASPNKTFSIEEPGQAVQNALVGCSPGFCFRNLFTNQINYSRLCQEEVPLTAVSFATTTSTATQRWADMHNHPCVAAHTLLRVLLMFVSRRCNLEECLGGDISKWYGKAPFFPPEHFKAHLWWTRSSWLLQPSVRGGTGLLCIHFPVVDSWMTFFRVQSYQIEMKRCRNSVGH